MVNLRDLAKQVDAGCKATMTKTEMLDQLGKALWQIGMLWDRVEGVNAREGPPDRIGTRNHRSMTYKLRKIARYKYP